MSVMKNYQSAQNKYKTEIKKKVKRQVQIVKPDATNEEVEAIFTQGGGASNGMKLNVDFIVFKIIFLFVF